MTTYHAVWLANVTGMDGSEMPAILRICGDASAYDPDDTFVVGWRETVDAEYVDEVPEIMWVRHNADDRLSGETCRSMCVGDVVVVGEIAYACESLGFCRLEAGPRTVLPGTFVEYLEATDPMVSGNGWATGSGRGGGSSRMVRAEQ